MLPRSLALLVAGCVVLSACGPGSPDPPPAPAPTPTPPGEQITGRERLGWDQQASDATDLASLRYAIYVDSARSELTGVSCATTVTSAGFACTAALPPLSAGAHTLALAAFILDGNTVLESVRSTSLQVVVVPAVGLEAPPAWPGRTITTTDRVSLRLELVADGLDEPSDLAFAPDGHIVVAERAGTVRIVRDGLLLPEPALVLTDVVAGEQGGLLGLALDPRFERTRFVYVVYTAASRSGAPVFRLARLREVGDTLGERAVLLDDVPASAAHPAAAVRVGPDGQLYVAFDIGDDPGAPGDLASYNGKVLRLNLDGTTPDDQPTPVWASGILSPRGMGWQTPAGTLWLVDDAAGGSVRLMVVAPSTRPSRGRVATTLELPPSVRASGLATYDSQLIPAFRGNVFVSPIEPPHVLRLVFDPRDPTRVVSTERLLEGLGQPVRAVAAGPDGAIYFCTPRELGRLVPAARR